MEEDEDAAACLASPGRSFTVPVRAQYIRFGVAWPSDDENNIAMDLSCVMFGGDGSIMESVHFANREGVQGSVVHTSSNGADGSDREIVDVCPARVLQECEVLCIVLSAADSPVRHSDLNAPSAVDICVYSTEKGKEREVICRANAKDFTAVARPTHDTFSDGHQSMAVCLMYRIGHSWQLRFVMETFRFPTWGDIVPEMKATIRAVDDIDGFESLEADPKERVVSTRRGEDRNVAQAARLRDLPVAGECAPPDSANDPAPVGNAAGECSAAVTRVKLELGWALWVQEAEDVTMAYNCAMYNAEGEELQAVNADNPEAQGAQVEEKVEPEATEAPAEGEGGEEGAAPEEEKDPKAERIEASVIIDLGKLPDDVHTVMLYVTQLGGSGFGNVKSAFVRAMDVSGSSDGKDFMFYRFSSAKGEDTSITGMAVCKLYKENKDSAYWCWRRAGHRDLRSFIDKADMKDVMSHILQGKKEHAKLVAAAQAAEEAGEEEAPKPIRDFEWRVRAMGSPLKGESPEDHQPHVVELSVYEGCRTEVGHRQDDRAKVLYRNGDSYFGGYSENKRQGLGLYVFASGGSYAGEYDAGKRCGQGTMMMPDGGIYKGAFEGDKFQGQGAYFYPDGSCYVGAWQEGRKHGEGVHWDKEGGCLRGTWVKGVLKGECTYDQPSYSFKGNFVKDIPAGDCSFTVSSSRTMDHTLPKTAAAFILAENGPTLTLEGTYSIPPGAGDEPAEEEEAPPDDQPPMPASPYYEGLGFACRTGCPFPSTDVPFPPIDAPKPPPISPAPE